MTNTAPAASLRHRLMQRVEVSRRHESQFHTMRRDGGEWITTRAGARCKALAQTGIACSSLVDLSPHADLPIERGFAQAELVLLDGQARIGEIALARGDAVCAPHDEAGSLRAGPAGARLFLRLSSPPQPAQGLTHFSAFDDDPGWQDFCPGVRIKALWDGGGRRSLLVRMRAGAMVGAHAHALEEECVMLDGEAFIGDTLLRGGEYQLAPQGSEHGCVTTDVGALFYVHGALDPAAYA